MAKSKKTNKEKTLKTALLLVSAIAVVSTFFAITLGVSVYQEKTRKDANERNVTLMSQALQQNNLSLCDQISGEVLPSIPNRTDAGINVYMQPRPYMTETQAKAKCKDDIISRRNSAH